MEEPCWCPSQLGGLGSVTPGHEVLMWKRTPPSWTATHHVQWPGWMMGTPVMLLDVAPPLYSADECIGGNLNHGVDAP